MSAPDRRLLDAVEKSARAAEARLAANRPSLRRRVLSASPLVPGRRWLAPAAAVLVVLGVAAFVALRAPSLSFDVDGAAADVGAFVAAEAEPRRLTFSEGTRLEVGNGSRAQVVTLDARGATVRLDTGRVHARVTHRADTRWRVEAGPYVVRVTGTTFAVAWNPERRDFEVALDEGSVEVSGPLVGTRVVRAGERLSVTAERALRVEPLVAIDDVPDAGPSVLAAPPPPVPTPTKPPVSRPSPSWLPLARQHAWAEAWAAVGSVAPWCERSSADELLLLADVARFAGHPREARTVLQAVQRRFPKAPQVQEAAYLEGLVLVNALGAPAEAYSRFRSAFDANPGGPLAEEALARALELALSQARPEASTLAARYLESFPTGPHLELARRAQRPPTP